MNRNASLRLSSSAGSVSMEALRQRSRKASNFASITRFPLRPLYTLAEFAFGRRFAEQDTFDGWRHLATSFLPVDALDGSFGAGRLSAVHKASPGKIIRPEPKTHET